ncbi:CesT family type III secretion system chaperone [Variovorax soli]|uniref:Tir chaperone protein (CesT) family protein n=1 Tax=Variovorax soli TaxID=376815 RepID=A0ABU1NFX7_9BURK|nr:CesT family type III secretion system chaperone [Variovorax soli]MDR6536936.1 hypothetical protein [Variovorax soli]
MISSRSHAGLAGYLLRNRIDPGAPRHDGAVALMFDGNARVLLHPGARGEIVAEAQLCLLSENPASDGERMLSALQAASTRPLQEAARLALTPDQDRLVLQVSVPADASSDQFELGLAHFLDAVNDWRARFGTL